MTQYPQVLVNVRVEDKSKYEGNVAIGEAIAAVEEKLGIMVVCLFVHRVPSP